MLLIIGQRSTGALRGFKDIEDIEDMDAISAYVDATELDKSAIRDVLQEMQGLEGRYENIAMSLRVKPSAIDRIKNEHLTPEDALREVLLEWLKKMHNVSKAGPPSWKTLVEAVAKPAGGNNRTLAQKIANRHPASAAPRAESHGKLPPSTPSPIPQTVKPSNNVAFTFGRVSPVVNKTLLNDDVGAYNMNCRPHGIALIINNEKFSENLSRKKEVTENDEKNLVTVFQYLGYIVEVHRDCTSDKIHKILEEEQNRDHFNYDSFVCCVLSHGSEGQVYGTDGVMVPLSNIAAKFDSENCISLAGKPKLFFLQACRGELREKRAAIVADSDEIEEEDDEREVVSDITAATHSALKIPTALDFYFSVATPPGNKAWRDSENGSWYISELSTSLAMYAGYQNLEDIVRMANRNLASYHGSSFTGRDDCPEQTSRLMKHVYFAHS